MTSSWAGERFAARRGALRNLVSDLLDLGTPLHAVGLQCHLHGEIEIDTDNLAKCVAEFRSWGLDVIVTELDVDDQKLPGPVTERDAIVAKRVNDVLAAISSEVPLRFDPHLGNFGPIQLDQPDVSPRRRPAQPHLAARCRVPAEAVHGRHCEIYPRGHLR